MQINVHKEAILRQYLQSILKVTDAVIRNVVTYTPKLVAAVSSVCSQYSFAAAFVYTMALVGLYHSFWHLAAPFKWVLSLQAAELKIVAIPILLVALYFLVGKLNSLTSNALSQIWERVSAKIWKKSAEPQVAKAE